MKEITLHDGIHFVDLTRIYFARRGPVIRSRIGLLGGWRPAVQLFSAVFGRRMANAVGSDERAGAIPAGRAFLGRIGRIGRMVWGGCWVVNWEDGAGKARVSWKWGDDRKAAGTANEGRSESENLKPERI